MKNTAGHFKIPKDEYSVKFSRSCGRGGQNVNKVETKVRIRWPFMKSHILTDEQKNLIQRYLAGYLAEFGELLIESQKYRTQAQNREDAMAKLCRLVSKALQPRKKRIRTKPSRAGRERRLSEKQKWSEKKALRKAPRE